MGAWRILGGLAAILTAAPAARGQTYPLVETPRPGDCFRIKLEMTLDGDMNIVRDHKPVSLKLEARARHEFPERVLAVDPNGAIQKTARVYETAVATISRNGQRAEHTLRDERRLIVAQQYKGQSLVFSPSGPLTREELELTSEHMDTLALPGLLPGRSVAVGETWKPANEVVQALCNFEGLASHDLTCKLEAVDGGSARVSVSGSASGIDAGALVKLTVKATYHFDVSARRLVDLEWSQADQRDQGPASPAAEVRAVTRVMRVPIPLPTVLSDVALVPVPDGFEPPAAMTQLQYRHDTGAPFDLVYGRDWEMVSDTREQVVMRLLDRGDFVAQATITPYEKARPGSHSSPDTFREAMAKSPGWEQGTVQDEGELPAEKGRWVYRIIAPGKLDGMNVVQSFFLVAGPAGDQVVVAFTMTPSQAEKLGTRDLTLVQGITLPER